VRAFFGDIRDEFGWWMVVLVVLFCVFAGMALLGVTLELFHAVAAAEKP
jgi:UPF0716 family protein affecting phage T7 exclusion